MTLGLILNTRASIYQERFHLAFGDLPWAIFDCPVTLPEPVATRIPSSADHDALIFTSQIGVGTFAPTPDWLNKKVFAVGQGTAEMAAAVGFTDVTQTGFTVEDMRMHLSTADFKSALYPSAAFISYDLPAAFPGRIHREVIYRMVPRADLPQQLLTPAMQGTPIVVPLFSRMATDVLADLLKKAGITADNSNITGVGISSQVFAGEGGPWHRRAAADQPTLEALLYKTAYVIDSLNT
jgi:uroporphyrinogen-III synthase